MPQRQVKDIIIIPQRRLSALHTPFDEAMFYKLSESLHFIALGRSQILFG